MKWHEISARAIIDRSRSLPASRTVQCWQVCYVTRVGRVTFPSTAILLLLLHNINDLHDALRERPRHAR